LKYELIRRNNIIYNVIVFHYKPIFSCLIVACFGYYHFNSCNVYKLINKPL
jgi:hypothetical protein